MPTLPDFLHASIRWQLRIYFLLMLVFLGLTIKHLVSDEVNPLWVVPGVIVGVAIGALLTGPVSFAWDQDIRQIVRNTNVVATVLLVVYVLFAFTKSRILGSWIDDPAVVGLLSSSLTFGTMWTRIQRTWHGAQRALKDAFPRIPIPVKSDQ